MKISILIITGLLMISLKSYSQDTLLFLSGKTVVGNITSTTNLGISITIPGKLFKNTRRYYKDELFFMSNQGHRTILYSKDTSNENNFDIKQMSYFIKGIQEGKEHYHAPFATLGGIATGLTGGIFGFWGTTIPTTYVFITGIKTPKINMPIHNITKEIIHENLPKIPEYGLKYDARPILEQSEEDIYAPYYNYGYQTAAKDKKIKNAIKGGIIGFIAFVAASYIMVSH